eukprot:TRINITY_DN7730_c0_g1_i1.p1 TRINITY_DN7730_c0_g1~~TRINITY_DN7730_c0_g1_i1.p1  ORF type:complete len:567 (-),score=115.82 TRINITY_DN7730_c0_g1_i1:9-1709(-)
MEERKPELVELHFLFELSVRIDAICVLYRREDKKELGRTEAIRDSRFPKFVKCFTLSPAVIGSTVMQVDLIHLPNAKQVTDFSKEPLARWPPVGSFTFTLDDVKRPSCQFTQEFVMERLPCLALRSKHKEQKDTMHIYSEYSTNLEHIIDIDPSKQIVPCSEPYYQFGFSVRNVFNPNITKHYASCFLVIFKHHAESNGVWLPVFKSEVVKCSRNAATWNPVHISHQLLNNYTPSRTILIRLYDWSAKGKHRLFGSINVSTERLMSTKAIEFINEPEYRAFRQDVTLNINTAAHSKKQVERQNPYFSFSGYSNLPPSNSSPQGLRAPKKDFVMGSRQNSNGIINNSINNNNNIHPNNNGVVMNNNNQGIVEPSAPPQQQPHNNIPVNNEFTNQQQQQQYMLQQQYMQQQYQQQMYQQQQQMQYVAAQNYPSNPYLIQNTNTNQNNDNTTHINPMAPPVSGAFDFNGMSAALPVVQTVTVGGGYNSGGNIPVGSNVPAGGHGQWLSQLEPKIQELLTSRQLEEYAELFVKEKITYSALCELDKDDLKDLGIPLGPRVVLWKAVRGQQ